MLNDFERKLVKDINFVSKELGVPHSFLGKKIGVSGNAIRNLINGNPTTLGFEKKQKLFRIIEQYKKVDLESVEERGY